jgi:hypothetical protein
MFLVASDRLASKYPELRSLILRVDAQLLDMDDAAQLRPRTWSTIANAPEYQLETIFDGFVDEGILLKIEKLECECGSLRNADRNVSFCPSCFRQLPDPECNKPISVYQFTKGGVSTLSEIRAVRASLATTPTLRVLVLSSNPPDKQLRIDREYKTISEAIASKADASVEFNVQPSEVQGYLLKHKPNFLHFSLHGLADGNLLFEGHGGTIKKMPYDQLREILSLYKSRILCLLFGSCYSASKAEQLLDVVPIVIAMRHAIGDSAAIAFSKGFYQAIVAGESVSSAFNHGVTLMKVTGVGDEDIPTLIVHQAINPTEVFLVGGKG